MDHVQDHLLPINANNLSIYAMQRMRHTCAPVGGASNVTARRRTDGNPTGIQPKSYGDQTGGKAK